jgi:hypothetical protein
MLLYTEFIVYKRSSKLLVNAMTEVNMSDKSQGKDNKGSSGRGFAGMDEDKQREIASEGGRAAHEKGTAHEFTPEEAREAGRKGGEASGGNRGGGNKR